MEFQSSWSVLEFGPTGFGVLAIKFTFVIWKLNKLKKPLKIRHYWLIENYDVSSRLLEKAVRNFEM